MTGPLTLDGVDVSRGGLGICHGVSLVAHPGQVTLLLGPNGAGKTTLLEAISGIIALSNGTVTLGGKRLTGLHPVQRARLGLGHVEQGRSVFAGLTVAENLAVAAADGRERAFDLFGELRDRRDTPAGLLSGGEQQMLVIARALVRRPSMLLIDELSLGLAPVVVARLLPVVRGLADDGVGVLLVEQYAALAVEIGDYAYVLNKGRISYAGDVAAIPAG